MSDNIPLIDLAKWRAGSAEERKQVIDDVDKHLQKLGFLMVKNHGIKDEVTTAARDAIKDFFALPESKKQAYTCPKEAYRGWIAPGLESNASSYDVIDDGDSIVDLKEAYSVGPVFDGFEQYQDIAPRWYADNIWPDNDVSGFKEAFTTWWHAGNELTLDILTLLGEALSMPDTWVKENFSHPMATITANRYPPVDEGGGWRVGPHTDFGMITVLDREVDNGLQIELEPGKWIDAPIVEDALVVNLGEVMVGVSNDRWRANPHRVAAVPGAAENISMIFFHEPDFDMQLPLNKASGEPFTAAEFLQDKMDKIIRDESA